MISGLGRDDQKCGCPNVGYRLVRDKRQLIAGYYCHWSSFLHDALECSKAIYGCNNYWYKSLQNISELLKIPLESSANRKLTTFTKNK